ncbi:MAG: response regulator [Bacteroidetes bacterium]|nr:response regulator [Bacteroidota bacterium]
MITILSASVILYYRHKAREVRPMKIMIVDDDEDVRFLLCRYMQRLGATPIPCCDGTQALERYRSEEPDAVLMDIAMPEMDGLEVTERIRSIDAKACIYILTAYSDDMLRRAAKAAGATGFYLKDSMEPLMDLIGRRTRRWRAV